MKVSPQRSIFSIFLLPITCKTALIAPCCRKIPNNRLCEGPKAAIHCQTQIATLCCKMVNEQQHFWGTKSNDITVSSDPLSKKAKYLPEEETEDTTKPATNHNTATRLDTNDSSLYESLRLRRKELANGIGRRYITRTQRGFLNVHDTYEDGPYAIDNIVGRLEEGQIVTSINSAGAWIEHDAGGWSISKFGGFTWLEPLDE